MINNFRDSMNYKYILKTILLAFSAYSICFGMNSEQTQLLAKSLWDSCDVAVVQNALNKGFPIDMQNQKGWTLLHAAAHYGKLDIVRFLLSKGASRKSKDHEGNTPLHIAAKLGHYAIVAEFLKQGIDSKTRNKFLWTPLHLASQNGHVKVVELLLKHGANREAQEGLKQATSLYIASFHGHAKVVELLLKHGANREAPIQNGYTPLHGASVQGHAKVVELLLKHGANIEAQEGQKHATPLYIASNNGHIETVELLLKHGANREARDQNGATSLHAATANGYIGIVKILLTHNAEINIQAQNWTPLLIALNRNHNKIAGLLLDYGARIPMLIPNNLSYLAHGMLNQVQANKWELRKALNSKDRFIKVKELLKQGAYADEAVQNLLNVKYRALLKAVDNGNVEVVKELYQEGLSLAFCDSNGNSLLHRAILKGHIPMIEYLLSIGADPGIYNKQGLTPTMLAAQKTHLLEVFFKYYKGDIWQDEATHNNKRFKKG